MTHKLPILAGWAIFSVFTVVANVLVIMTFLNENGLPQFLTPQTKANISTSANSTAPAQNDVLGIQTSIQEDDARIKIVSNFLERYNSPLEPYSDWGQKLVTIADKYGIDFRLLPAIAMTESNLCKVIPPGTYTASYQCPLPPSSTFYWIGAAKPCDTPKKTAVPLLANEILTQA